MKFTSALYKSLFVYIFKTFALFNYILYKGKISTKSLSFAYNTHIHTQKRASEISAPRTLGKVTGGYLASNYELACNNRERRRIIPHRERERAARESNEMRTAPEKG